MKNCVKISQNCQQKKKKNVRKMATLCGKSQNCEKKNPKLWEKKSKGYSNGKLWKIVWK